MIRIPDSVTARHLAASRKGRPQSPICRIITTAKTIWTES
jgi:hypothetical protein